jgi:lactoylglutathione lyase
LAGSRQLKVGLRVDDLEASCALYREIGFRQIPHDDQPNLRYLTFGLTWLILSSRLTHPYHNSEREKVALEGPLGSGFVLAIPTTDLEGMYRLWKDRGLTITLEPRDVFWARIFYGLDPDGYEVMFEQHHERPPRS